MALVVNSQLNVLLGEVGELALLEHAVELSLSLVAGTGAVVGVAQVATQSALELIGIGRAVGQGGVDLVDLGRGERAGQTIVLADHLVGDGHGLAEHVLGRVGQADVVAV